MIPRLHVVTDDAVLARPDFPSVAAAVLAAGGARVALHLRGPGSSGAALHGAGLAVRDAARASGARLLVNDRVDVALALGVDAVQLGRRSLPAPVARGLLGEGATVGVSVHAVAEAVSAEGDGADFLLVGTIFPTPSHPGRRGGGPRRLVAVARACGLPLIAIGGITPARAAALRAPAAEARPHGVAVLRGVWDAPRPDAALESYLEAVEEDEDDGAE